MNNYWMGKEQRAEKAKIHTEEMEQLYPAQINQSADDTMLYSGIFFCEEYNPLTIYLDDIDTVSAIYKYTSKDKKVAALNFASYKNPGGAFLYGSSAQEECLCHESNLYNILSQMPEYYEFNNKHKNKALYWHRGLYTPNVIICRENEPIITCNIITCAAPNKKAAKRYCNVSDEENYQVLEERIKFVLGIALDNHIDTLIVGAYGCGVFGKDPYEVAKIFKSYMEYYGLKEIVFAIPDSTSENYIAFKDVLKEEL